MDFAAVENLIEEMIDNQRADKIKWASALQDKGEKEAWLNYFGRTFGKNIEHGQHERDWAVRILRRDGVI
jgi:hypothetical protein